MTTNNSTNNFSSSPLTTNGDIYYYNSGNSRLPVGSSAQVGCVPFGTTLPGYDWPYIYPSKRTTLFSDFTEWSIGTNNINSGFLATDTITSGTGTGFSWTSASDHPGIVKTATGTTGSGGYSGLFLFNEDQGVVDLTDGQLVMETSVLIPATLSNSGARYTVVFGVSDTGHPTISPSSNGILIQYSDNINSGAWNGLTMKSGTSTNVTSSVTVATSTWYNLRMVINAGATQVTFYINETSIGSSSTNIPTDSTQYWYLLGVVNTSVSSSLNIGWDYWLFQKDFTTAR